MCYCLVVLKDEMEAGGDKLPNAGDIVILTAFAGTTSFVFAMGLIGLVC
jgi:hypothetical protein